MRLRYPQQPEELSPLEAIRARVDARKSEARKREAHLRLLVLWANDAEHEPYPDEVLAGLDDAAIEALLETLPPADDEDE